MANNSLALLVRAPEIDMAGTLMAANQIRNAETQSQLAQLKMRQATNQESALANYNQAKTRGDPNALNALNEHPDLYAKMLEIRGAMGAQEQADFDRKALRNARDAQYVAGLEGEAQAQAWQEKLAEAHRDKRIDRDMYSKLASIRNPSTLMLRNIIEMGAKIPTQLESAQTEKALAEAAVARQKPTDTVRLGKDDVLGRMVPDQSAPGGVRFVPLASNTSGGPGDPATAAKIQGGLDELNRIPGRYGGNKGVFSSAVGPFQGDESFNYGAGPLSRAWGSLTATLGATGANSSASPAEVRRAIAGGTAALAASIKPLIRKPGEGAWSDIDQAKLDSIVGNLTQASDEAQYRRELNNVRQRINANFGLQLPEIGVPREFDARLPESQASGRRTLNGKSYVKINGKWFEE